MDRRDDNLDLPADLKNALRGIFTPANTFRGNDTAILAAARAAGTRSANRWRWAVGMGIAAAVAIAGTLFWVSQHGLESSGGKPGAVAVTYVKTGDIRDAFYVARHLKNHEALEVGWDANRDGTVDEKDVPLLAAAAVKIDNTQKGATP